MCALGSINIINHILW